MKRLMSAVIVLQMLCVASIGAMEETYKIYDYDPSRSVEFDTSKSGYQFSIPVLECGENYNKKTYLTVPYCNKEKLTAFSKHQAVEIKDFYNTSLIRFGVKEVQEAAQKQNISDVVQHYTTSVKNLSFESVCALDSSLKMRGAINFIVSKLEDEAGIKSSIYSYHMGVTSLSKLREQSSDDYSGFVTLANNAFGFSDTPMLVIQGISITQNTPFISYVLAIPLIDAIAWVELGERSKSNHLDVTNKEDDLLLSYYNLQANTTGFNAFMQVKKKNLQMRHGSAMNSFDDSGFFETKDWDVRLKNIIRVNENYQYDDSCDITYDKDYRVSIPVLVNKQKQTLLVDIDDMRSKGATGLSQRIKRATDGALVTLTFDSVGSFTAIQKYNQSRNDIYKLKKFTDALKILVPDFDTMTKFKIDLVRIVDLKIACQNVNKDSDKAQFYRSVINQLSGENVHYYDDLTPLLVVKMQKPSGNNSYEYKCVAIPLLAHHSGIDTDYTNFFSYDRIRTGLKSVGCDFGNVNHNIPLPAVYSYASASDFSTDELGPQGEDEISMHLHKFGSHVALKEQWNEKLAKALNEFGNNKNKRAYKQAYFITIADDQGTRTQEDATIACDLYIYSASLADDNKKYAIYIKDIEVDKNGLGLFNGKEVQVQLSSLVTAVINATVWQGVNGKDVGMMTMQKMTNLYAPKEVPSRFFTPTKIGLGVVALGLIGWALYKKPNIITKFLSQIPYQSFFKQVMGRFSR